MLHHNGGTLSLLLPPLLDCFPLMGMIFLCTVTVAGVIAVCQVVDGGGNQVKACHLCWG